MISPSAIKESVSSVKSRTARPRRRRSTSLATSLYAPRLRQQFLALEKMHQRLEVQPTMQLALPLELAPPLELSPRLYQSKTVA